MNDIAVKFILLMIILGVDSLMAAPHESVMTDFDIPYCSGDFEPDGDVDGSDLAVFSSDFGRTNCSDARPCPGDFNEDGDVDGSDLAEFSANFGRSDCPVPLSLATEIAEEQAREVWGEHISSGPPFLLYDAEGNPFSYAFPVAVDAPDFPGYEEIFDAVRRVGEEYSRSDPRFYTEVENLIGQSGTVEVAVNWHDFPVLVVRHALHPYFLSLDLAIEEASLRLGGEVQLEYLIYEGPHELYYQFNAGRDPLTLHAYLLKPPEEIFPIAFEESEVAQFSQDSVVAPVNAEKIEQVWRLKSQNVSALELNTVKWLNHYKSVPVVQWTHWCVPTAATMVAGYWDHFVDGATFTGYGRLFDYWFDHQPICQNSNVTNVPNFIDEIIDHTTPTCTWSSNGFLGTINNLNQYNFTWNNTKGTLSNDWGWPFITQEIDNDRPVVWGVGPNKPHAMTAIGYRISGSQKFVIVYNTWGATAKQQLAEYNYDQWSGAANTKTGVGRLWPGGGSGGEHAVLTFPRGEEVILGPTTVSWFVWGDQIKWTAIYFSKDGGNTWNRIHNDAFLATQAGWNSYAADFNEITSKGRVKIENYSSLFEYISGDGSPNNFFVQGKPDLIPDVACRRDNLGRLMVKVNNQGTTAAQASVTKVEFFPGGIFTLNTPGISPSGTVEMPVNIPAACWNPDCDFQITVDSNNQVDEANENNNSASSACIG